MMLVKVITVPPDSEMLTKRPLDVCFICGNKSVNQSYHRIPTDPTIREKWLKALKINVYHASIRVCSMHFQKEDFHISDNTSKKLLQRHAVPSKLLTVTFSQSELARKIPRKDLENCCVCGAKDNSMTYYTFPLEPNLRKKWLDACGIVEDNPAKITRICAKHFKRSDYDINETNGARNIGTLKKDAVPSLLIPENSIENINIPVSTTPTTPKLNKVISKTLSYNKSNVSNISTFRPVTPVSVNPEVLSSLSVVLGESNSKNQRTGQSIERIVSSTPNTNGNRSSNSSTLSAASSLGGSSEVIEELSDIEVNIDELNSVSTKSNSCNLNTDKSGEDSLSDGYNSSFSIEECSVEEVSVNDDEIGSNSIVKNRPAKQNNTTRYRPIRPKISTPSHPNVVFASVRSFENIQPLVEATSSNKSLSDHSYKKAATRHYSGLLWRYPSDITEAHCKTPENAWAAVKLLKSALEKTKKENEALRRWKRRAVQKMTSMKQDLRSQLQEEAANKDMKKIIDGPGDVEPWWV